MSVFHLSRHKLSCLKPGHQDETMDFVCLDSKCQQNELCCYLCQEQNHKDHEMTSIKVAVSRIAGSMQVDEQSILLSASIEDRAEQIRVLMQENRAQLADSELVVTSFNKFVDYKRQQVIGTFELSNKLAQIASLPDSQQFQRSLLQLIQLYDSFEIESAKEEPREVIYNVALEATGEQLAGIIKSIGRLKTEGKLTDFELLCLFHIEDHVVKAFRPKFVQHMKAPCMEIKDDRLATMMSSSAQRVLAMEPSLEIGKKIKKWRIKIVKLASWIGVGVCHINALKTANWNFNYSNTKHGSYFISSNGYSWSSYQPQYNSKFESFSFATGDIVVVEFNGQEKKVNFAKEGTQLKYSLEVELNGDPLHPAVNLTGVGDSVEIIH